MTDDLITRIREAARRDETTQWFCVTTPEQIAYVESIISIQLPELLKQCYMQIGNGGFGPSYGITGLPGGHESSWGDLIQTVEGLRQLEECEQGWLPLIDYGCAEMLCVDCDEEELVVVSLQGEIDYKDYDFTTVMERWCEGKIPDLRSEGFIRER
ncbi:MAG: SMI1/KNR4 family protein [Pirellulales bacterium]